MDQSLGNAFSGLPTNGLTAIFFLPLALNGLADKNQAESGEFSLWILADRGGRVEF